MDVFSTELGIRLSFVKTSEFRGGVWTHTNTPRYATAPTPLITSKCELLWCDLSFCFMCSWELVWQSCYQSYIFHVYVGWFVCASRIGFLFPSPGNERTSWARVQNVQGLFSRGMSSSPPGDAETCHTSEEGKLLTYIAGTVHWVLYCGNF
jgi:hypothetical protein